MNIELIENLINTCNTEQDWNLLIETLEANNFNVDVQNKIINLANKKINADDDYRKVPKRWVKDYLKANNEIIWFKICRNLNLTQLSLNDNDLLKIVLLDSLSQITRIKLYMNKIGDKGADYISKSDNFSKVKYLNLTYNNIGADGANQIINSFQNLKELYLGRNKLGDRGAKLIAENPNSKKLKILDLRENNISEEGLKILSSSEYTKDVELNFKWRANHSSLKEIK